MKAWTEGDTKQLWCTPRVSSSQLVILQSVFSLQAAASSEACVLPAMQLR